MSQNAPITLEEGSYIVCTYNVVDTSSETILLDSPELFNMDQIKHILIDGKSIAKNRNYLFDTLGDHEVIYIMDMDTFNSMYCMFRGAVRLTDIDFSHFDMTNNTTFYSTFHSCVNLKSVDISYQNTSNVTTLNYMFWNGDDSITHKLTTVNFRECDFSNVVGMYGTFRGCHSLYELNFINMQTSTKLTTCYALFNCCYKLPSLWLGKINTTNVTNMSYMFGSCLALTSVTFTTPINNLTTYNNVFYNITTTGTFNYPSGYTFTKLTNQLPSKWTAAAN